jgi:hypothetical protein
MSSAQHVGVLLPADLVARIDLVDSDRNRFVAVAVARELTRREALLQSLSNPHPETVGHRGEPLGEWAVAIETDIVDPSGGTPLRWVDGRGWVSEA